MYELLAVIVMIAMIGMLFGIHHDFTPSPLHLFPSDYLLAQSRALAEAETVELDSRVNGLPLIRFSEKGNVSKAMTLDFNEKEDIIVELGPGRLVFR